MSVGKRIARGHVHAVHLVGYRVNYALEQRLVTHNHGCFSLVGYAFFIVHPLAYIPCLNVLGCGRGKGNVFGTAEVATYIAV